MTRLELGLVGALAGALFVIVLHPVTRPVVQIGLTRMGPSQVLQTLPDVPGNAKVLPDPTSLSVAARWVREGCRKVVEHDNPSVDQLLTLVELCQQSSETEPSNAFWKQTEAVFQFQLGNQLAATVAWEKAARSQAWDDHQLSQLQTVRAGLRGEFGRTMSWHDSTVLNLRDAICEQAIGDYAAIYLRANAALRSRFLTLRNGMLVRNGSKIVRGSLAGWSVVEKAASGSSRLGATPRETVAQRFQFVDELSRGKLQSEALEAREILSSNEAYRAAIGGESPQKTLDELAILSWAIATTPGATMFVGLMFVCFGLLAWRIEVSLKLPGPTVFQVPAILGVGSGIIVYGLTGLVFPALFLTIVASGFLIRPQVEIDSKDERPDSWIRVLAAVLTGLMALTAVIAVAMTCAPAAAVQQTDQLDIPEVLSTGTLWSIAVIVFGSLIGAVQAWAFVRRVNPYRALAKVSHRSFLSVGILFLAFSIVSTPVCLAIDLRLHEKADQLLLSEPGYYLQNL